MDNTNTERQARWRERQKATGEELAKARARIAELELEATLKHPPPPQPERGEPEPNPFDALKRFKTPTERDAYKAGLRRGEQIAKQQRPPSPPKPATPQLNPESAAAKQIKSLLTANKNLRRKLNWITRYGRPTMTPETFRTIVKALHPDRTPTPQEREQACQLFNALFGNGAPSA